MMQCSKYSISGKGLTKMYANSLTLSLLAVTYVICLLPLQTASLGPNHDRQNGHPYLDQNCLALR